ncbi:MAG: PSD1 and planctomycete cytochrome C domain-containing protein [Planctomycetota bacterium]
MIPWMVRFSFLSCLGCSITVFTGLGETNLDAGENDQAIGDAGYRENVRSVFYERCVACHGALKQEAGLRLDSARNLMRGSENGAVVAASDPDASSIVQRVTSGDLSNRMPPEGEPLHPEQIDALKRWIGGGAPVPLDEREEADPDAHWAFQPPQRSTLPVAEEDAWNANPIDAWIASSREQRGLRAQSPASASIWLRRVYLDLIGLPPTHEEIRAFEKDASDRAKELVVEKLLASPHYGERWGRHWMDIWRYSDWWGLGEEVRNSQKHMWHWRDWIIESLNEDKGYDQMLREMLAADEMYPEDLDKLRATGYLARQYFKFNRTSWLDETIEHTAKGMLGMTFNCTKCHDHKYDPLTQQDYYRFRAIFEPYQVRMEMVPGQPDFARDGIPRAFDCNLDAPTYVHVRGDDRNPDRSQAMEPAVPEFLRRGNRLGIEPVALPLTSVAPGLRTHVVENLRRVAWSRVRELEGQRRELDEQLQGSFPRPDGTTKESIEGQRAVWEQEGNKACAELIAIDWRHEADVLAAQAAGSDEARRAAQRAAYFDKLSDVAAARLAVAQGGAALAAAPADKKVEAATRLANAESNLETALKQLDAPGEQYRSLRGAEKTAESNLESDASRSRPFPGSSTGRRSALARWMTDRSHPLTARVAVNHVWARHFGQPLVPTVFDFGRKGTPPTHQELLDFLALELMEHGWSLKHLHRMMVLSKTYAMRSSILGLETAADRDPDNRFYWRMNAVRMEAQSVRDSLLYLAGDLDPKLGGPSIPVSDAASRRRSLYFFQSHNEHEKFLSIFDDANVLDCYRRAQSIVPQQALALQNSPLIQSCSQRIADRIAAKASDQDDTAFIAMAFEWLLATPATEREIATAHQAMQRWRESAVERGLDPLQHARIGLVRSLINHNDFLTVR